MKFIGIAKSTQLKAIGWELLSEYIDQLSTVKGNSIFTLKSITGITGPIELGNNRDECLELVNFEDLYNTMIKSLDIMSFDLPIEEIEQSLTSLLITTSTSLQVKREESKEKDVNMAEFPPVEKKVASKRKADKAVEDEPEQKKSNSDADVQMDIIRSRESSVKLETSPIPTYDGMSDGEIEDDNQKREQSTPLIPVDIPKGALDYKAGEGPLNIKPRKSSDRLQSLRIDDPVALTNAAIKVWFRRLDILEKDVLAICNKMLKKTYPTLDLALGAMNDDNQKRALIKTIKECVSKRV